MGRYIQGGQFASINVLKALNYAGYWIGMDVKGHGATASSSGVLASIECEEV